MSKKNQSAITQVHLYIKEHYKKGDQFTSVTLLKKLKYLTRSSITAALWKLTEEGLLERDWSGTPYVHTVTTDTFCSRPTEDRDAPAAHHRHYKTGHQVSRPRKGLAKVTKSSVPKVDEVAIERKFDAILTDIERKRAAITELKLQITELEDDIDDLKSEAEILLEEL